MKTTNPEILQVAIPQAAEGMALCNAQPPYNNLQVREACQLAQNLPLIAQHTIMVPFPRFPRR